MGRRPAVCGVLALALWGALARGAYAANAAAAECTRAEHGYFVDKPRATKQVKCVAGRFAPGEGSSNCTDANAGFFVDREQVLCDVKLVKP